MAAFVAHLSRLMRRKYVCLWHVEEVAGWNCHLLVYTAQIITYLPFGVFPRPPPDGFGVVLG